jgi:hypothetical protein
MAPQFVLEVTEGSGAGSKIELGVDPVTIGRNQSNKLMVTDEAASNYHAEVTKEAIGYVVSDLGSTNGTKVNGEKIVKSPLAHGARIQIGSTVIVFKNLGAPTEEDAVFGTVVLDSDKLDRELAAAKSGGGAGRVVAALVLIGLIGLGAYGVARLIKPGGNGDENSQDEIISEAANPSFREGTEDDGSPKGWRIYRDDSRNSVMVDNTKGRESGDEKNPKASVKFQREAETKANTLLACRQAGSFDVDKGSAYQASAYVMCPGARGLYGLRLTWVGADKREMACYKTISGAHPDWKLVECKVRPPKWAGKLRLAVVALGNTGNVWFDDVALKPIPLDDAPAGEETLAFKGVNASLDASGRLHLERQGFRALTGVITAEGQGKVRTDQNLARVESDFPQTQGEKKLFRGSIYDFSQGRSFNYDIAASKSNDGVKLDYSFATLGEELTLDELALHFTVEPLFSNKPQVYVAGGLRPLNQGSASGVSELILRSAEHQLVLNFGQPARVTVTPRGEKKELTVLLASSPSLSSSPRSFSVEFASRSARAAADRAAAIEPVRSAFQEKRWASFTDAVRRLRSNYPNHPEMNRVRAWEAQYNKARDEARKQADAAVALAESASGVDAWQLAYKNGKTKLNGLKREWAGSPAMVAHFDKCLVKLEEGKQRLAQQAKEEEAKKWLKRAKGPMDARQWMLAEVYLKKVINDYPGTESAKSAKKLLEICQSNRKREEMIIKEEQRLLRKIKNYELNKQYKQAIRIITTDEAYRKYGKDMKEIKEKLETLRAKAGE